MQVLHEVNSRAPREEPTDQRSPAVNTATEVLYLDRPTDRNRVLLKVIKVILRHGRRTLDTYAILDDGAERTMLLPAAAEKLGLQGTPESLALRTIRQDVQTLQGASVSFRVSPASQPKRSYHIKGAFTATRLGLGNHSYPVNGLQKRYKHLAGLPLQQFDNVSPLILIGADLPHLITPNKPVRLGPPGGPAAIRTRLGWTLQGPTGMVEQQSRPQQCLLTMTAPDKWPVKLIRDSHQRSHTHSDRSATPRCRQV